MFKERATIEFPAVARLRLIQPFLLGRPQANSSEAETPARPLVRFLI